MEFILPFVPLLTLIGVIVLIYRYFKKKSLAKIANGEPLGVSGWLTLLVVVLLVIHPLMRIGVIGELGYAEYQHQPVTQMATWGTYYIIMSLVGIAASAVSVYGGWGLAKGKDKSVVTRAKFVLWVTGPVASVFLLFVIPLVTLGREVVNQNLVFNLVQSVIWAGIWTAYLSKSRLVKITYGIAQVPTIADDQKSQLSI